MKLMKKHSGEQYLLSGNGNGLVMVVVYCFI